MKSSINLDAKTMREACGHFPSGVVAIAAVCDGTPQVLVASSFSVGVSLEPPLAAVFVQKTSYTWALLSKAKRLGVSILSVEHAAIGRQLASSNREERFRNVQTQVTPEGALHLVGAAVRFDCSVFATYPAGDHDAIHLLIHDLHLEKKTAPLVFHNSRFTQLVAPQMLAVPPATQQLACAAA